MRNQASSVYFSSKLTIPTVLILTVSQDEEGRKETSETYRILTGLTGSQILIGHALRWWGR